MKGFNIINHDKYIFFPMQGSWYVAHGVHNITNAYSSPNESARMSTKIQLVMSFRSINGRISVLGEDSSRVAPIVKLKENCRLDANGFLFLAWIKCSGSWNITESGGIYSHFTLFAFLRFIDYYLSCA